MSAITLRPGRIAAVFHAGDVCCIYMAPGVAPEAFRADNMARDVWTELPAHIRALIERHYEAVFALPPGARGAFLETVPARTVQS